MQQEKFGGAADLLLATLTAANWSRQDRPKKFNFQPWPEINKDIGQLGQFPGDERPTHYFGKYYMMKYEGDERKMNPFDIEKEVSPKLKGKPSDISSWGKNALLIQSRIHLRANWYRKYPLEARNVKLLVINTWTNVRESSMWVSLI